MMGADLQKLRNLNWLSDQTINFYMEMLSERQKRNQSSRSVLSCQQDRIHYFNTFFYKKLSPDERSYVYKDVSRWTRRAKVDLLNLDKVVVPVHVGGNHWCLGVINMRERRLEYFDSLGGRNPNFLKHMRRFVEDEVKQYHPERLAELKLDEWQELHHTDVPHQNNGSDCGVFTIKFADYVSENRPFNFTHKYESHTYAERAAAALPIFLCAFRLSLPLSFLPLLLSVRDMPYFRRRIALEVLYGRVL